MNYTKKQILLTLFFIAGTIMPGASQDTVIETITVQTTEFIESLKVQGNMESEKIAKVSARIPGPIEAVFVEEGDAVEAGKTRLFQIDSIKLQKNVEIRQQELAIARFSLQEKEARLKQVMADLDKAQSDLNRCRLLWEDNSISIDSYEKAQLKHKVSMAAVEHTQAIIALGREQLKQAELALRIAEKDYADSTVFAPIDGKVVSKLQQAGEMAAPGMPIIIIKDPDRVEMSAHLPSDYYHRIIPGETEAEISTSSEKSIKAVINYKSPVINPQLRTFEIKCGKIAGKGSVIPGALAEINIILAKKTGLAVPISAILNRGTGKVVFVSSSNKAKMIKIETGIENDGKAEVISGELKDGDAVVIRGQRLLNDGQPVSSGSK
jgi:RND family efflux transporter MFP subunit